MPALYNLLKSFTVQDQIQAEVIGSTIPTISETRILNFKVPLPSKAEILEIVKHVENIKTKIAIAITCKEKEIEKLKEYKATLINSAVTGKIKITAENQDEENRKNLKKEECSF